MVEDSNMIKQKLLFNCDIDKLPDDVSISTMTIVCKLDIIFNVENIARYIDLKHDVIVSVKHGDRDDTMTNRTLLIKNQSTNINKKKQKAFYNQVSIQIKTKTGLMNMKFFRNGSIQITGCKNLDDVAEGIRKIFDEFRIVKAIINYKTNKIEEKKFVNSDAKLDVNNLHSIQICMINSNFSIGFEIDRDKLFKLLLHDNIKCSYDPIIHACVNIKYDHSDKIVSVFVFEPGSVVITGAGYLCNQILGAYNLSINIY